MNAARKRNRCFERLGIIWTGEAGVSNAAPACESYTRSFRRCYRKKPAFRTLPGKEAGVLNGKGPAEGSTRSKRRVHFDGRLRHRRFERLEGPPRSLAFISPVSISRNRRFERGAPKNRRFERETGVLNGWESSGQGKPRFERGRPFSGTIDVHFAGSIERDQHFER